MSLCIGEMQVSMYTSEINHLVCEQMIANNRYQQATEGLAQIAKTPDVNMESAAVKGLEAEQSTYDNQKQSIESQLSVLREMLKSYKELVKNDAKNVASGIGKQ